MAPEIQIERVEIWDDAWSWLGRYNARLMSSDSGFIRMSAMLQARSYYFAGERGSFHVFRPLERERDVKIDKLYSSLAWASL